MKKCLFCGRSAPEVKMTGEHVLRRELVNQVLWEAPKSRTEVVRRYADGVPTEVSREIPQSILDQTLKDVCGECNNGWMNDLENRAEKTLVPLLRGERVVVTSGNAEVLATWAAKTAMVRARVDADPYTVPEEHRTHLMNTRTPPPNLTVWVATCDPHPSARTRHYRLVRELPGTPILQTDEDGETWMVGVETPYSLGHVTTIVINHIALFIAEADSEALHTELVTTLDPTSTATRLWPAPNQFHWPLPPVLTPDEIDDIGSLAQPIPTANNR